MNVDNNKFFVPHESFTSKFYHCVVFVFTKGRSLNCLFCFWKNKFVKGRWCWLYLFLLRMCNSIIAFKQHVRSCYLKIFKSKPKTSNHQGSKMLKKKTQFAYRTLRNRLIATRTFKRKKKEVSETKCSLSIKILHIFSYLWNSARFEKSKSWAN